MLRKIMCLMVMCLLLGIGPVQGSIFVSTGHTGAQVQVDENHTQYWTYTVVQDVNDLAGGLFTMKIGSQTTESVTLDIFVGTIENFGTATNLVSVTLGPGSFEQQFTPTLFKDDPSITLSQGVTYTAVLHSPAVDAQSTAYFIKGGRLSFVNEDGSDAGIPDPVLVETSTVPEPSTLAIWSLLGVAGLVWRRRKTV